MGKLEIAVEGHSGRVITAPRSGAGVLDTTVGGTLAASDSEPPKPSLPQPATAMSARDAPASTSRTAIFHVHVASHGLKGDRATFTTYDDPAHENVPEPVPIMPRPGTFHGSFISLLTRSNPLPDKSDNSSVRDRQRDTARAGLDLSEERVAELMARFDDVDATIEAIRGIDVTAFEPHAVFAPNPVEE